MNPFRYVVLAAVALLLFAIACGSPPAEPAAAPTLATATLAPTPVPATDTPTLAPATDTPIPTAAGAAVLAPTDTPVPTAPASGGAVFTLGEDTVARYQVEEVLANTGFKVATGETSDVAGRIAFGPDGEVIAEDSRIAVRAATLRTDSDRRDGYVRRRTLETDTYPEVVFQPTAVDGLPVSLSDASGSVEFAITGDLTVRDQTREVTWDAMADFAGDGAVAGFASVEFAFDDFGMDKPRVAVVLSVEDTIRLELDFAGTIVPP